MKNKPIKSKKIRDLQPWVNDGLQEISKDNPKAIRTRHYSIFIL
jgi:hypothetical protein